MLRADPGATLQDGGRHGYQRYGVTPAGPMDWVAFQTANSALANDHAAAIEISTTGLEVICEGAPLAVAFAGGAFLLAARWGVAAEGGAPPVAAWRGPGGAGWRLRRFRLSRGRRRLRDAGYDGQPGYPYALLDGRTRGRMLRAGDVLPAASVKGARRRKLRGNDRRAMARPRSDPFRVVLGPQGDYFTVATLSAFFEGQFTLTPVADRMAYRFNGGESCMRRVTTSCRMVSRLARSRSPATRSRLSSWPIVSRPAVIRSLVMLSARTLAGSRRCARARRAAFERRAWPRHGRRFCCARTR